MATHPTPPDPPAAPPTATTPQQQTPARPLGHIDLILIADAVHNLIDGLAIGAAFVIGTELGLITWLVIAAHEIS